MLNFDNTANAFISKSNSELRKASILFKVIANATLTKNGGWITPKLLWLAPVRSAIKKTIYAQFCGGENIQEAAETAAHLFQYGVGSILDYGVEGKTTEKEFDEAKDAFIQTIVYANEKDYIPFISIKLTGFFRFGLLEKIQNKQELTANEKEEYERATHRLKEICAAGANNQTMILVDAEESWIQDPVDVLVDEMMEQFNKKQIVVYNTFQMYRHDRLDFLKRSHLRAKEKGYMLGAKLVRGAYMEKERVRAKEMNYPSPIQPDKAATDADYDTAVLYCLEHINETALFIGTHNETSSLLGATKMKELNIANGDERIYFSQLFGMSDNISFNLAQEKYNVSKYLPYGPVKDVVPYLLRRANENTSVAGQTTRELDLIKKELKRRQKAK